MAEMPTAPTHFERLGLPVRFALDLEEIERNYLERSRTVHPDYHQLASSSEQRVSLELTAALNEAYATLRQPFRRAEYLLSLEGGPSTAEHKQMAPAFLEEMLELRLEIEELRASGQPDSPARLALEQQLSTRSAGLREELRRLFAQLETLPCEVGGRRSVLTQIRQVLNAARYIHGLLHDLRAD